MDKLNLRAIFLPAYRADAETFWLGLGLIALMDAVRVSLGAPGGFVGWLLIVFFVVSLHINRLRDAGREGPLVIISVGPAILVKGVVALLAMSLALIPDMFEQLEAQGINLEDTQAAQQALYGPEFQQAYTQHLESNPAILLEAASAATWPSMWGFWGVTALIALWFASLRSSLRAV